MHDRVIVDNLYEFQHSSSRAGCTFPMQDSRVKRGSKIGNKIQQAPLPADPGLYNSTFPSLVNCILTIPECQRDHHGSCTSTAWSRQSVCSFSHPRASFGSDWALKVVRQSPLGVSQFAKIILLCSCVALCACFAHCCHYAFIVRSASNLSSVPWFHSATASVSMFTINDNCLFLLLFQFLGRCLNTTRASVQTSRPLHQKDRSRYVFIPSLCVYVPSLCVHVPSLHIC